MSDNALIAELTDENQRLRQQVADLESIAFAQAPGRVHDAAVIAELTAVLQVYANRDNWSTALDKKCQDVWLPDANGYAPAAAALARINETKGTHNDSPTLHR